MIKIDEITTSWPRRRVMLGDDGIKDLAQNIKEVGLVNPIIVFKDGGKYEIIAGNRRYLACKEIGITEIPCQVKEIKCLDDNLLISLSENLQRNDLTEVEKAELIEKLSSQWTDSSIRKIADKLGLKKSYVAELLKIAKYPSEVKAMIQRGEVSAANLRALSELDTDEQKIKAAKVIRDNELRGIEARGAVLEVKGNTDVDSTTHQKPDENKVSITHFKSGLSMIRKNLPTVKALEPDKRLQIRDAVQEIIKELNDFLEACG
jgi:ParB family chromosome partitioning protein